MPTLRNAFIVMGSSVLVSCGGGGGSSSPPPPSATVPSISTQPVSSTVAAGTAASVQLNASGNGTLTYSWRLNGAAIGGATSATYSIASTASGDAGTYDCVVTNSLNGTNASTTSSTATLTVVTPPAITTQPASSNVLAGAVVNLQVAATGNGALTYAWRLNGVAIGGAAAATYTVPAAAPADAGSYDVMITNTLNGVAASTASAVATLTVVSAPSPAQVTAEATVLASSAGHVASTSPQAGATFLWAVSNGTITAGQGTSQVAYTAGHLGDARVLVTVTNLAGAAVGMKNLRVVTAIPVASIFTSPVIHPGDFDVRSSAAATSGNTYQWSWQNLGAQVVPPADVFGQPLFYGVTNAIGAYSLSVTVRDAANNTVALTRNLTVANNVFLKDRRDPLPRSMHTATLMNDGRVLVVAGDMGVPDATQVMEPGSNSRLVGSTEIYDPVTERWADAGSISARFGHSATLLDNGRVLVVGGTGPTNNYLLSGALYDPTAGTWTPSGSLLTARTLHTATLLADGRVLVTGGWNGSGAVANSEIYDPANNSWSATGALQTARVYHSATMMADGRVLVAAGRDGSNGGLLKSVEIYDPATGNWSAAASLISQRNVLGAVLLPSGKVLQLGDPIQLYDPVANTWASIARAGSNPLGAGGTTAILLTDGTVLASGGALVSAQLVSRIDVVQKSVSPVAGSTLSSGALTTSTQLNDGNVLLVGGIGGGQGSGVAANFVSLATAKVYVANGDYTSERGSGAHRGANAVTGVLPDGRILFAGGRDSRPSGSTAGHANADLFNPANNLWGDLAPMSTARASAASAVLANGRMLVAGGTNGFIGVIASVEYYDQPTNAWSAAGALSGPRFRHTLTALADGTAVAVGGVNATFCNCTMFQSTVDRYNPVTNTWSPANPLLTARDSHTATLLSDGRVLVAGGYGGVPNTLADTGAALASAEIYDPTSGNWTATGSMSAPRRDHVAISLGGGRVLVVGGSDGTTPLASAEVFDVATGLWTPAPSMAAARQSPSVAAMANGNVLVVNGLNGSSSAVFGSGTAEVYDPVANTWTPALQVTVPRAGAVAVSLPDGRVMIVGGLPNFAGAPEFIR